MSKYEIDVWEYANEFKNLDTNETFYGYQVCELLEHKDQQISDLEAKLAESEKKNFELVAKLNLKEHKPAFCTLADRDCEAIGQVAELKQQLSEKDKEYQSFKKIADENVNYLKNRILEETKNYNQDKISFAIEQLEQIINLFEPYENEEKDTILCANNGISFLEYINNQINELKGEK